MEVLREYRYLLLGHHVIILSYIKGEHNIVANAFFCLDLLDPDAEAVPESYITDEDMAEMYFLNMPQHSNSDAGFPLSYPDILKYQLKDNQLR